MDAQLKKGILEMCILYSIKNKEMYGYDIMQNMCKYFPDVNESTFYAILRRLNRDGITSTYIGNISNGPPRKYYKITKQGEQYLEKSIRDWKKICIIVKDIGI